MHMRMWNTRRRYSAPRSLSYSTYNRYKYFDIWKSGNQHIYDVLCWYSRLRCAPTDSTQRNHVAVGVEQASPALPALAAQCQYRVWCGAGTNLIEEEVEVGGSTLGSCDRTAGSCEMPLRAALPMHLGIN